MLNDVIWRKTNPMPNFRGRRFTNAHETLIWAANRDQKRYTFNYEAMKQLNDELQMRSDWLFPICAGGERLKDESGAQGASDAEARGAAAPHPDRVDQARRRGARPVFRHRHDGRGGQAARAAVHRHRARPSSTRPPRRRIEAASRWSATRSDVPRAKRAEPRIPFGTLVERGLIAAGHSALRSRARGTREGARRWLARLRGRRRVRSTDRRACAGRDACNGWTFWHYEADGALKPIDALREAARQKLEPQA